MTDHPSNPTGFEPWLTDELRRLASAADDPLPAAVVARRAMDVDRGRRERAARIRRWTPLVGLAAVLILPAAFYLGGSSDRSPTPSPVTPTANDTWEALLVRRTGGSGIDVVSVDADGQEHQVRHHDFNEPEGQAPYPVGYLYEVATASSDGWLAQAAHAWETGSDEPGLGDAWMLIDLHDPSRPTQRVFFDPGYLDYAGGGDVGVTQWSSAAAWGPGDRLVTVCSTNAPSCTELVRPQLALQLVDASTGQTRVIEGLARGPNDPLTWAADGSGLVTVADRVDAAELADIPIEPDNPYTLYWEPERAGLGVDPVAGGPRIRGVPSLAWRPGPRWTVEGGAWVDPDSGVGESADGERIDWVRDIPEGLAPGANDWVSLAADGRSTWLLLAASSSTVVLAHATETGAISVRSPEIGVTQPAGIAGIAPDDSVIAIYVTPPTWRATGSGARIALVPTDGGRVRTYPGAFAGFVPADLLP